MNAMKYEICKGVPDGDDIIWTAIAWTDVRSHAVEIATSLRLTTDKPTAVLVDGEVTIKLL